MKLFARSFLVLLCTATLANADWVLVQKTTAQGEEKELTSKIKGEQARVDVGSEMGIILDASGMTMIMHAQKVVMKADPAQMKALMDAASKSMPAADGAKAKPVATGEKEKIGEWNTEIYTWEGALGKCRFWITKDIPKYTELNAVSDKLSKAMGNPMVSMVPQASDFDGYAVKSEIIIAGNTMTTLLVSAKEQDVDAKAFATPEGYTEMKMPAQPQQ